MIYFFEATSKTIKITNISYWFDIFNFPKNKFRLNPYSKTYIELQKNIFKQNPFFFYKQNFYYLKGEQFFLQQIKESIVGIVISGTMFLFFLFLSVYLIATQNDYRNYIFVLICLIFLSLLIHLSVKNYKFFNISKYGRLIEGTIKEVTRLPIGPSDMRGCDYCNVQYSFETPQNKTIVGFGQITLWEDEEIPTDRTVLILYLNDNEFIAL